MILILLFIGELYILTHMFNQKSDFHLNDIQSLTQHWQNLIDREGSANAYAVFKSENAHYSVYYQHDIAHIFSDLLYKKMGIKAIEICDDSFDYACYHSIIGNFVRDHGIADIEQVEDLCRSSSSSWACNHGLGHGIMATLGYDKLNQSLDICKNLMDKTHTTGCLGGIFMEYNLHTMANQPFNQNNIRKIDPKNVFAPCPKLDSFFQPTCYLYLPQWWSGALPKISAQSLGQLCAIIPPSANRQACFGGQGTVIARNTNYNEYSTISECKKDASFDDQFYCISQAAFLFDTQQENADEGESMCDTFSQTNLRETCTKIRKGEL